MHRIQGETLYGKIKVEKLLKRMFAILTLNKEIFEL
jgi:hypothetical protein